MCRKIAMVMVATFGLRASVQTQGMLALFVISVALGAHLKYQPFDEPVLDRLEVYGLGAAFTTLYFGMFFFTDDVVFAPWWGFMVTFVIMAANVLFISMFFLYIFRAFREESDLLKRVHTLAVLRLEPHCARLERRMCCCCRTFCFKWMREKKLDQSRRLRTLRRDLGVHILFCGPTMTAMTL